MLFKTFLHLLGLNSGPHACEASILPLEPHPSSKFYFNPFEITAIGVSLTSLTLHLLSIK
jgi:hypothetical protein